MAAAAPAVGAQGAAAADTAALENVEAAVEPSDKPYYRFGEALQSPEQLLGRSWVNWVSFLAYIVNVVITYLSLTGIFGETNTDLSKKYQTLVTPKGYAFAIWGLIFIGEGLWALWQLCPPVAGSWAARCVAPWWWATCLFQCLWTVVFAQDSVPTALAMMLCILTSLVGAVTVLDKLRLSCFYYGLQRAPFALHLGWIVCASVVNINVCFDWARASPTTLLVVAITSLVLVVMASGLAVSPLARTAEPILGLVAAWALVAVGVELEEPTLLNDPSRHNPYTWPEDTIRGVQIGAYVAAGLALALAALGLLRCARCCACLRCCR